MAKDFVLIATFAALTAVLGLLPPIPLPLIPVPITAQTFGVMIAGCLLKPRLAFFSMVLFIILVAAGFPLLAGGRGGMAAFIGPSSGFLLSWPFASYIISMIKGQYGGSVFVLLLGNILGGVLVVYACGIIFMVLVLDINVIAAMVGVVIFLPGDILKAVIASLVASKVMRANVIDHHED